MPLLPPVTMQPKKRSRSRSQPKRRRRREPLSPAAPEAGVIAGVQPMEISDVAAVLRDAMLESAEDVSTPEKRQLRVAAEFLQRGDVSFCDFDWIHSTQPVVKNSASETSVFFGTLSTPNVDPANARENRVAVKLFLPPSPNDNGLLVEVLNYKLVVNRIIANGWSPHLVTYVGSFVCPTPITTLPPAVSENINLDFQSNLFQWDFDIRTVAGKDFRFLVTERAHNAKTLRDWLKEIPSAEALQSVLFQILWTFETFNRLSFRHNDAHLENVLIEDWSDDDTVAEREYYIMDDGMVCALPNKSQRVKIFDFDRSALNCDGPINAKYDDLFSVYKAELRDMELADDDNAMDISGVDGSCTNTTLDEFCPDYGTCNGYNPKFDTYHTLVRIWAQGAEEVKSLRKELMEHAAKEDWDGMEEIGAELEKWSALFPLLEWCEDAIKGARNQSGNPFFLSSETGGDYYPPDNVMRPTYELLQSRAEMFQVAEAVFDEVNVYVLPDRP